uniref:DUF2442 domain-containing protein n=1 Tax=Candidatus Kentrum eta TaxID=2126337 RepID=A0A450U9W5_9GAMM|nr:MAG: Protein of unknown function (DUF2442) [Candidatus Kentron sp. H]VFJ88780.1 MAG: Protein of unknown function (DUF2442) [Candidatus Kentron sp. H]VFJ95034.1 MAG: Protein of unknown function (DUF2442) [Candidatus Kentron sp. H]
MDKYHRIENVEIKNGVLSLIVDGITIQRKLEEISGLLTGSTEEERNRFEVSPSGYGIHWPSIDEDLSIDGMLGIGHGPEKTIGASHPD